MVSFDTSFETWISNDLHVCGLETHLSQVKNKYNSLVNNLYNQVHAILKVGKHHENEANGLSEHPYFITWETQLEKDDSLNHIRGGQLRSKF